MSQQKAKRTIGPFRLEKQLGVGGMGNVYLATYTKTGQKVALKVLSPQLSADKQLVARFEREVSILKKLRHPHIVRYYGGGKHDGQHFYAMELMPGGSLAEQLKEKQRVSWEQAIEYGKQICSALEHAHKHGIVHRDLKPANLFLTQDGKLKLGDFGIARDTQATALTAAGKTVGTYAYMAPEQISGQSPITRKTDLYALGCLLYQLLTGTPPFQAETAGEMLYQHMENEPPRVSATAVDCPVWLETIVSKLLEKEPDDRYYDALAVHTALDEVGQKVAQQTSLVQETAAGGQSAIAKNTRDPQLQKILGTKKKKKKKKKNQHVPFYEQGWFLVASLLFLAAGIAWALWPPSEQELFTRGKTLMSEALQMEPDEDGRALKMQRARDKFFKPLLQRFPNSKHAEVVNQYLRQIETNKVRRQVETNIRLSREPQSEAERLYREAREFEEFGDRVTALQKYRGMVELLEGRPEDQAFVNLARRRIKAIEESHMQAEDRVAFVNESLRKADQLERNGRKLKAHKIWNSIVDLYSSNRELEQQVQYAEARLDGQEPRSLELDLSEKPSPGPHQRPER